MRWVTMPLSFLESHLEDAALEHLAELGWRAVCGIPIAPGEPGIERKDYGEVLLVWRLQAAARLVRPTAICYTFAI